MTTNVFRFIKNLFEYKLFEIDYNFLILCFINSILIRILCKKKIDFKHFKKFDQNRFDFESINNKTFFERKQNDNFLKIYQYRELLLTNLIDCVQCMSILLFINNKRELIE